MVRREQKSPHGTADKGLSQGSDGGVRFEEKSKEWVEIKKLGKKITGKN